MEGTRKRASLYVRLSREAGEANLSLAGMMEDLRELAERLGYDVASEHMDNGISGAVRDRPEFTAWLEDARSGMVDALLTYHADRLTREGVNAAALVLDTLEGKDPASGKVIREPVRLVDCTGIDSEHAEAFRWRFVIAAEVARAERERIKARNIVTRKRLDKAGRYAGGAVPYGCRVVPAEDGKGKVLTTDNAEAETLRAVAQKLIGGDSMRGVVRWLNAQGSHTRRGLAWQRSSLRQTLLSDASKAHVFDLATFRAIGERLSPAVAERPTGGRPRRYLLAGGQAVCGTCGRKMTTSAGRYVCSSTANGEDCDAVVTIKAEAVDEWVAEKFLAKHGNLPALEARVIVTGASDLDGAERAVEDAEKALLIDLTAENMERVQEARGRLAKAQGEPQQRKRVWMPTGQTIAQRWEASDGQERAELLARVLELPVVIDPNPGGRSRGRQAVDVAGRVTVTWGGALVPL